MNNSVALELKNITKTFGSVVANKNVNLKVYTNEVLSLLGENGSGKTTLMNMISGIYYPDDGQIFINGEEVVISSAVGTNSSFAPPTSLLFIYSSGEKGWYSVVELYSFV